MSDASCLRPVPVLRTIRSSMEARFRRTPPMFFSIRLRYILSKGNAGRTTMSTVGVVANPDCNEKTIRRFSRTQVSTCFASHSASSGTGSVDVHAKLTQGFHQKLTRLSELQYSYVSVDKSSVSSFRAA